MQDKSGKDIEINDILFAVRGTTMKHYIFINATEDNLLMCQEVDSDFNVIKQPRGKRFRNLLPRECFLHSKLINNKYVKVL